MIAFLLLIPAAFGFGASSWEEWLTQAREDIGSVLAGVAVFILAFVALYGLALYMLSRVGFFDQFGRAFKGVLDAIGLSKLWTFLGSLIPALL